MLNIKGPCGPLAVDTTPYLSKEVRGQNALVAYDADGCQYGVITVAVVNTEVPDGHVIVNNRLWDAEDMPEVVEPEPVGFAPSGFCLFPIHRLTAGAQQELGL